MLSSEATGALRPHKIVLPVDLLQDLHGKEAERCLDDESHDGFYYLPNFISEAEEEHIMQKVRAAPLPKWRSLQARRLQNWGGQLSKQVLLPEPLPDFLVAFPPLIERIRQTGAFEGSKHGAPNHCLVNEYRPGQGIMPHEDGSAYFSAVATVSLGSHTLLDVYRYSDGIEAEEAAQTGQSSARAREQHPRFSILQERRSLLLTSGAAYRHFLHGIAERSKDERAQLATVTNGDMLADTALRDTVRRSKSVEEGEEVPVRPLIRDVRLSLTLRDVERVASQNLMTVLLGKR